MKLKSKEVQMLTDKQGLHLNKLSFRPYRIIKLISKEV